MDAMYRASAEMLLSAAQLGDERNTASADQVRQGMLNGLRDMVSRCRAAGVADAEIAEARYAIVAFIDERVLQSNWAGRAEWMSNPLQLQLYREYTAGENFFARMRALLNRGVPSGALEVYYLCLAMGFTGAMPGAGGAQAARSYLDAARGPLTRSSRSTSMSPNGTPSDPYPMRVRTRSVVWPLILASAVVALVGLCALAWSLHKTLDRVAQDMATADAAQTARLAGSR